MSERTPKLGALPWKAHNIPCTVTGAPCWTVLDSNNNPLETEEQARLSANAPRLLECLTALAQAVRHRNKLPSARNWDNLVATEQAAELLISEMRGGEA